MVDWSPYTNRRREDIEEMSPIAQWWYTTKPGVIFEVTGVQYIFTDMHGLERDCRVVCLDDGCGIPHYSVVFRATMNPKSVKIIRS